VLSGNKRSCHRAISNCALAYYAAISLASKTDIRCPAVETLEKFARALQMPLYELLYDGDEPPVLPRNGTGARQWGASGPQSRYLARLCQALARMQPDDRDLLLYMTQRMTSRKRPSK
jgi:hypothetical protein